MYIVLAVAPSSPAILSCAFEMINNILHVDDFPFLPFWLLTYELHHIYIYLFIFTKPLCSHNFVVIMERKLKVYTSHGYFGLKSNGF